MLFIPPGFFFSSKKSLININKGQHTVMPQYFLPPAIHFICKSKLKKKSFERDTRKKASQKWREKILNQIICR
jgi:hypothetical protein